MANYEDLLFQTEWWVMKTGQRIRISNMTEGHAENTAKMLIRNLYGNPDTTTIQFISNMEEISRMSRGCGLQGDMALMEFDRVMQDYGDEMYQESREDWLRRTPLVKALHRRAGLPVSDKPDAIWANPFTNEWMGGTPTFLEVFVPIDQVPYEDVDWGEGA